VYNQHAGETCIIIGNGPSLNDIPLEFLKSYLTFGTNRIYLLKGFEPTYYVSVNPLVINQSVDKINKMKCPKFIRHTLAEKITDSIPLTHSGTWTFSKDPMKYIFEGFTVTYVCLQLAYWMGFKDVLLVGVDHYFKTKGKKNAEVTSTGKDPNHFSPNYFGKGVKWNLPDLENSERAYKIANRIYQKDGRTIHNLTTKTALEVFPREDWHAWQK